MGKIERREDQDDEPEHAHAQPERDPEVCHERQPQLEQDRQAPEGLQPVEPPESSTDQSHHELPLTNFSQSAGQVFTQPSSLSHVCILHCQILPEHKDEQDRGADWDWGRSPSSQHHAVCK